MIYARAHDRTVAEDYYAAMTEFEASLNLPVKADDGAPLALAHLVADAIVGSRQPIGRT